MLETGYFLEFWTYQVYKKLWICLNILLNTAWMCLEQNFKVPSQFTQNILIQRRKPSQKNRTFLKNNCSRWKFWQNALRCFEGFLICLKSWRWLAQGYEYAWICFTDRLFTAILLFHIFQRQIISDSHNCVEIIILERCQCWSKGYEFLNWWTETLF